MATQKYTTARQQADVDGEALSVVSRDGVLNRLTLYQAATNRGVILCMPAMGVRASFYRPLALNLALAGWHTVTADLRGVGESGVRVRSGARFGYREMVELDWHANVAVVRERFPGLPVYLMGHSLGGQLNALYAGFAPATVAGLIFIASGSVYYKGWSFPGSVKILVQSQLLRGITEVVGYLPGDKLGFGGIESKGVMRDWATVARTGKYQPAGADFDYEAGLQRIIQPSLALTFTDDDYAPAGSAQRLLSKMPLANVTQYDLDPKELSLASVGHFGWVKRNEEVVRKVTEWLESGWKK